MINSFFGLEMGKRALSYFRQGMDTAGHNIANADVEGYSRQRVEASSTTPFTEPGLARPAIPGQIGTGVKMDAITHIRSEFLDKQYQEETTLQGYWNRMEEAVDQVEMFVQEPNGEGFKIAMDNYWSALQELQKRPDDSSTRVNLVETTKNMTTFLDQLITNYDQYRTSLNEDLKLKVQEANDLIDQIASLNTTIAEIEGLGQNANDLVDQRILKVEKLSELIDCKPSDICDETDGEFKVYLDSKLLVQGRETRHLVTVPVQGNQGFLDVQIEDNEFDHVSDPNVMEVIVEQGAAEAVHQVGVRRLASETAWKVGNGNDKLDVTDSSEALGVKGNFRLQVDSSGVRKTSRTIKDGEILSGAPAADQPQEYQFRIQAGDVDSLISVAWDDGTTNWQISDNLGNGPYPAGPPAGADPLTLSDLAGFINDNSATYENIEAETNNNKLTISSSDDHIISLADSKNNLLSGKLNMQNGGTIYTVEVTEEDTLETIRNKINGLYAPHYCEDGFEEAQDWLHANIADDGTGSMYLTLESNAVGEANRINVLGDDGGSLYVAKKLGLVHVDDTETVEGETSFMETSRDALFTVDSDKYLSATNSFREARKITAEDAYQASEMQEVLEGVHFTLKETGSSGLTVKHHVNGGEISAIMEARDDVILDHIGTFDEIAYQLSLQMNAVHYAGHGTGDHAMSTGVAFFNPIAAEYGASRALEINSLLDEDTSYIGTASDDGDGYTLGEGDGSNALRMAQLKQADILESGSSSFSEFYESFIAELGSEGQTARTMADNQRHLVEQIENQRQSIMGVSIDEEMMDITQFQQAFNAMARFITVQDELLDKMINGMGIVGR